MIQCDKESPSMVIAPHVRAVQMYGPRLKLNSEDESCFSAIKKFKQNSQEAFQVGELGLPKPSGVILKGVL
ncbi:hypothetical protein L484_010742 [Morus notabilis]|uniref:Uncharacterized protein n=1 Tax=Morus notabilis TaxID=981085 RepID=W9SHL1_9ROSA|nr:hypothetical protein L484_010742 [Morus notabilis]